jgi:hypothetical protein
MTPADRNETSSAINPEATEEMAKYGITRVPIDYFHYKGYRYTNLDDATCSGEAGARSGSIGQTRTI